MMFLLIVFQKEYTSRHPKGELPVKINDVLFSFHAIAMNCVFIFQCLFYERAEQRISPSMATLLMGLWVSIVGVLFLAVAERVSWLQYLYFLSYIKVGTTPIKYTPQVSVAQTGEGGRGEGGGVRAHQQEGKTNIMHKILFLVRL